MKSNMVLRLNEDQLHERNGTVDLFLNALQNPVIITGRSGLVLFSNESAQRILKQEPSASRGVPLRSPQARETVFRTLEQGIPQLGVLEDLDGKKLYSNMMPIINSSGEVIGCFSVLMPLDPNMLSRIVSYITTNTQTEQAYHSLARHSSKYTFENYIGECEEVKSLIQACRFAAATPYPILITGETGCGKEILSSAIHEYRVRNGAKPFVKINCTAIPGNLMESELFGHEKGAFTSAAGVKKGKFEIAEDGTILLDEIGDMELGLQGKLLRVLEEREFERIGGTQVYPMRAHIIATTNKNLAALSQQGLFRSDLYYRLSTIEICVPPLRKRGGDIMLLIDHFLTKFSSTIQFSQDALDYLCKLSWPGNVRQLEHFILRASVLYPNQLIHKSTAEQLLFPNRENKQIDTRTAPAEFPSKPVNPADESLAAVEEAQIRKILQKSNFNISLAAATLQITRNTLYNKMKKYQIALLNK